MAEPVWILVVVVESSDMPALATLLVGNSRLRGVIARQACYFRQRGPVRSLGDLNARDPPQALRISDEGIAQLQRILQERFGLNYSPEQAQAAGRAILRFFGYKLLRELEQERRHATAEPKPRQQP